MLDKLTKTVNPNTQHSPPNAQSAMNDIFAKCDTNDGYFGMFRSMGDRYFTMPVMDPVPGTATTFNGRKCIQWSINNYLGLAQSEEIRQVAIEAAKKYSTSAPMGSRMMTGNTQRHIELENEFASYLKKESAVLFNYGYLGVLGTIQALVGKDDIILIDKLSHASMVDAMFLSQGKFRVFRHNDMNSLEEHLKHLNRDRKGGILVMTEGVFGMQGDLAKLDDIVALKDKYEARLFIDDAHGFGVMGDYGRGTASYFGVHDKVDVYFGTFAKAYASIGGVTATKTNVAEWIRYNARSQVFAKSLPMIYVETLHKTLEIIRTDENRRARMWEVSKRLRNGLRALGYNVGDVPSPIVPVYVPMGDLQVGMQIVIRLRELGVFVTGVTYPVVPKGVILFRMIPTAAHSDEEVDATINAYKQVRDELKLNLTAVKEAVETE
ncbi:MAG TPA: pyridoxal phosphate-dependent aminotransferase family protein [Chitinophagales bacterium]|nr:pyridoxal phosphate-dependent aminotransferase family protein [Chitinophagales bacterium]